MVGVINPNSSVSLQLQKQLASTSEYMLLPGQPFPDEGSATTSGLTVPTSTSSPPATSSSGHPSLSGGAIAGIVIGAIVFVGILIALFYLLGRNKSLMATFKGERKPLTNSTTSRPDHVSKQDPGMQSLPYSQQGSFAPYMGHQDMQAHSAYHRTVGGGMPYTNQHGAAPPYNNPSEGHFSIPSPSGSPPPQQMNRHPSGALG